MNGPERASAAATVDSAASVRSRAWAWVTDGPAYPANAGDLRTANVLGLPLPLRATIAVVAVALLLLLDYHGRINGLVDALLGPFGTGEAESKRLQSLGRFVVQGAIPLAIVLLVLRDRPSRYGLRVGDWRAGVVIAVVGCAVMTPVVLALAHVAAFATYYAPQGAMTSSPAVALTSALEVLPAEFFFRGFLLFALLRVVGPIAVVIATLPFAFIHLGKPEVETLSTLAGGLLYGWLDWRTGSVLWSGLTHTWILSLAVIAAAAAAGTGPAPGS
ncbi:MAG: CPBP family intramembrane glutamic endopeptidase [Candidatus Limnocylindrales bacterium]